MAKQLNSPKTHQQKIALVPVSYHIFESWSIHSVHLCNRGAAVGICVLDEVGHLSNEVLLLIRIQIHKEMRVFFNWGILKSMAFKGSNFG